MAREPFLVRIACSFNKNAEELAWFSREWPKRFERNDCVYGDSYGTECFNKAIKSMSKHKGVFKPADVLSGANYWVYSLSRLIMKEVPEGEVYRIVNNGLRAVREWSLLPEEDKVCYRIGSTFGEELLSSDIKIDKGTIVRLEDCHPVFLEFHKPLVEPQGRKIHAAFVGLFKIPEEDRGNLDITHILSIHGLGINSSSNLAMLDLHSFANDQGLLVDTGNDRVDALLKYISKCFLYVHSGNPDLRELKPRSMSKQEKVLVEKECGVDLVCPQTLVSWNWKKPANYYSDGWEVKGFFRWQWCGKGRTSLELVWVPPHSKHWVKESK